MAWSAQSVSTAAPSTTYVPPPEEEYVPPPPEETGGGWSAQSVSDEYVPPPSGGGGDVSVEEAPQPNAWDEQAANAPGPVEQAANAVGTFVTEHLPGPINDARNALGGYVDASGWVPPVAETLDAAGEELSRGSIGGAAGAVLQGGMDYAMRPGEWAAERAGERALDPTKPPIPTREEVLADPSLIADAAIGYVAEGPIGRAVGDGQTLDEWANANPARAQQAMDQGGGKALYDAWLDDAGASDTPPAGWTNPLDADYSGNPLERAGQAAGALGDFAGSVKDSVQDGSIGPFARRMAADTIYDPSVPGQLALGVLTGGASLGAGVAARGGATGVARALNTAAKLGGRANRIADVALDPAITPVAEIAGRATGGAANLLKQSRGANFEEAGDELINAGMEAAGLYRQQAAQNAGAAGPVAGGPNAPAGGPATPAGNQQQGFQAGAAPAGPVVQPVVPNPAPPLPMPAPPRRTPNTIFAPPAQTAGRRTTVPRPSGRMPANWIRNPNSAPNRAWQQQRQIVQGTQQPLVSPATGRPVTGQNATPRTQPTQVSPQAIGMRNSRWTLADGTEIAARNGNDITVAPAAVDRMRQVYDSMFTAPIESFWDTFGQGMGSHTFDAGDDGIMARWRGAMRQSLWMLDDWSHARVHRQFPQWTNNGRVDWDRVQAAAGQGNPDAQKALAGKRHHDLMVYRVMHSTDPDGEIYNMIATYHLDQAGDRFTREPDRYWQQRAEMIGEVIHNAQYTMERPMFDMLANTDLGQMIREMMDGQFGPHARDLLREYDRADLFNGDLIVLRHGRAQYPIYKMPQGDIYQMSGSLQPIDLLSEGSFYRGMLERNLRARLDSHGLGDIGLKLIRSMAKEEPDVPVNAEAFYRRSQKLIAVSLEMTGPDFLSREGYMNLMLDHEVVHALKDLDLFLPHEWNGLVRAAKSVGRYEPNATLDGRSLEQVVKDTYAGQKLSKDRFEEELVAHLYSYWRAGNEILPGARTTMQKVLDFILGVGQAFRNVYPENILKAIQSGDIGTRPRTKTRSRGTSTYDGRTLYHGTPRELRGEKLSQNPPEREWSLPWANMGVFMTDSLNVAGRYAYGTGFQNRSRSVYKNAEKLKNPYEMSNDDPMRSWLLGDDAGKTPASRQDAVDFRRELEAAGHDGIVVRRTDGAEYIDYFDEDLGELATRRSDKPPIEEVIFFRDVPVERVPDDSYALRKQSNSPQEMRDYIKGNGINIGERDSDFFRRFREAFEGRPFKEIAEQLDRPFQMAGTPTLRQVAPNWERESQARMDKAIADAKRKYGESVVNNAIKGVTEKNPLALRPPTIDTYEQMLSQPMGHLVWYDLSGMAVDLIDDQTPLDAMETVDLIAATSGGEAPLNNTRLAVALKSKKLRKEPGWVGLRDETAVENVLQGKGHPGPKFNNFSRNIGAQSRILRDSGVSTEALPTIDMWQFRAYNIDPGKGAASDALFAIVAQHTIEEADALQKYLGQYFQPIGGVPTVMEHRFVQAGIWVLGRVNKGLDLPEMKIAPFTEASDYMAALLSVKDQIAAQKIPGLDLEGRNLSLQDFHHPLFADAAVRYGVHNYEQGRHALLEIASTNTPTGIEIADIFDNLRKLPSDDPVYDEIYNGFKESYVDPADGKRKQRTVKGLYKIQQSALEALSSRQGIPGGKKSDKQPSVISRIASAILGQDIDISRVNFNSIGTWGTNPSPQVDIPLSGATSGTWFDPTQPKPYRLKKGERIVNREDGTTWVEGGTDSKTGQPKKPKQLPTGTTPRVIDPEMTAHGRVEMDDWAARQFIMAISHALRQDGAAWNAWRPVDDPAKANSFIVNLPGTFVEDATGPGRKYIPQDIENLAGVAGSMNASSQIVESPSMAQLKLINTGDPMRNIDHLFDELNKRGYTNETFDVVAAEHTSFYAGADPLTGYGKALAYDRPTAIADIHGPNIGERGARMVESRLGGENRSRVPREYFARILGDARAIADAADRDAQSLLPAHRARVESALAARGLTWETSPFLTGKRAMLDANGGEAPNFSLDPDTFAFGLGEVAKPDDSYALRAAFAGLPFVDQIDLSQQLPPDAAMGAYAIPASRKTQARLNEALNFTWADGSVSTGERYGDALERALNEVDDWWTIAQTPAGSRSTLEQMRYDDYVRRYSTPEYPIDAAKLDEPYMRDTVAVASLEEAFQRALPESTRRDGIVGKLLDANDSYLNFRRRVQLYNYANLPRFVAQQQVGNTITALIAKPTMLPDFLARPGEYRKAVGKLQGKGTRTFWDDVQQKMGVGIARNISQSNKDALGKISDRTGSSGNRLARLIAPDTGRAWANGSDILFRESAAWDTTEGLYKAVNRSLPKRAVEWRRRYDANSQGGLRGITDRDVQRSVGKFLNNNRSLIDGNTGRPHTTIFGRTAKFEPVWNATDLREHLRADLATLPGFSTVNPQTFHDFTDRLFRDSQEAIKGIQKNATEEVERVGFSWRQSNLDEGLSRVFMFHYWMTRAGGLYVQQGLKNPALFAAYSRMMEDFETQAAELDAPKWMTGFFQLLGTPAGFSIWYSPTDLASTLLTFADWQYGDEPMPWDDLTGFGKARSQIPFMVNPLLDFVGYGLGLYGRDAQIPDLLGLNRMATQAIDVLNIANAHGRLPEWVRERGVGVDAAGNPTPIPVRPLAELYAKFGHAISASLSNVTGLRPVPVPDVGASQHRYIAYILEQDFRTRHPDWDQGKVDRAVTTSLADHGSMEYQAAYKQLAELPYMGKVDTPLPDWVENTANAVGRMFSPMSIIARPEQAVLDSLEGLTPSGAIPPRNPGTDDSYYNDAKYGASKTVEGRQLQNAYEDYWESVDPAIEDAHYGRQAIRNASGDVVVGGYTYTADQLAALPYWERNALADQYLAEMGVTRDQINGMWDERDQMKIDNPQLAGYLEYRRVAKEYEGGPEKFVQDTMAGNPSYNQFVLDNYVKEDGSIDYGLGLTTDAYLAAQGTRPTYYTPVSGNEPNLAGSGPPALAGVPAGQQLLPSITPTVELAIKDAPGDYGNTVGIVGPGVKLRMVGQNNGWAMIEITDDQGNKTSGHIPLDFTQVAA